jgi:hypothetical protein
MKRFPQPRCSFKVGLLRQANAYIFSQTVLIWVSASHPQQFHETRAFFLHFLQFARLV